MPCSDCFLSTSLVVLFFWPNSSFINSRCYHGSGMYFTLDMLRVNLLPDIHSVFEFFQLVFVEMP